jgi:hypothetical protein
MRAIIMADGAGERWLSSVVGTDFEGMPKQLLAIDGTTTLVERTAYLLRNEGITDIWITTHNPEIQAPFTQRFLPENNIHCLDKLQACKDIWQVSTMFLYGDVYYSVDAIKTIVNRPIKDRFLFFGRMNISYYTGHYHEIFCKKIQDFDYLEKCINWIKTYEPSYGGGWELYRRMCGVELDKIRTHIPYDHWINIDDLTDDFDDYGHYQEWKKGYDKWDGLL